MKKAALWITENWRRGAFFVLGMIVTGAGIGLIVALETRSYRAETVREWNIDPRICVDDCVSEFMKSARASALIGAAVAVDGRSNAAAYLAAVEDYCRRKHEGRKCCGDRFYSWICEERDRPTEGGSQ